jgi:YVTN family beta-propeller protein
MHEVSSWKKALSRRGITPSLVVLAVVTIAVFMLLPSLPAGSANRGLGSSFGEISASISTPSVTGATILKDTNSLTLAIPGTLNIFTLDTSGKHTTSGFSTGGLLTAKDKQGHIAAAIAVTPFSTDSFTTAEGHYSIGGVGVTGFQYYGVQTQVLIPPIQPTSTLTKTLVLPESALVVVVALAAGQGTLTLTGITGLDVVASHSGSNWSSIIGHSKLSTGTYTISETTPAGTPGGGNQADVLGIFAFSNTKDGFIDKRLIPTLVATIPVSGAGLPNVEYGVGTGAIFVTNSASDNGSVISDATDKVVAALPVGLGSVGAVYDSGTGELFAMHYAPSDDVTVINATNDAVMANISVGSLPWDGAYDSAKGEIFVANYGSNNVSVISDTTDHVVATVAVGVGPQCIAYDGAKGELFVGNSGSYNLSVISDATNTVVATINVTDPPFDIAYAAAAGKIFVTDPDSQAVSIISAATNTLLATVPVGNVPWGVAVDGATGEVFVANVNSYNVSVISEATDLVVATISDGGTFYGITYDSGNGDVYLVTPLGWVGVISYVSS